MTCPKCKKKMTETQGGWAHVYELSQYMKDGEKLCTHFVKGKKPNKPKEARMKEQKYNYNVIVKVDRHSYDVKCTDKKDLDSYLKALDKQKPYFELVRVDKINRH